MFTGLVSERGRILTAPESTPAGGVLLRIGHGRDLASRLSLGASLAVSGVCLTVVEQADFQDTASSTVEMGEETLRRTTLGELAAGDAVNLEPSLALGDPLGGHWVQGHVDGVLQVVERSDREGHRVLAFSLPAALARYVVEKGSVTIDGVSLTVTEVSDVPAVADETPGRFAVWLIPHTLEITTLGSLEVGDRVNYEADVLAKYVERSIQPHLPRPK
jgi:riboflavin synthase